MDGPNSPQTERQIVSLALTDRDAFYSITEEIVKTDIYDGKLQKIYEAALWLDTQEQNITPLTISDWLKNKNILERIGGRNTIDDLFSNGVQEDAASLIRIIKRDAMKRKAIEFGKQLQTAGWNCHTAEEIETLANTIALSLTTNTNGHGPQTVSAAAVSLFDTLQYWTANPLPPGEVRGLSTLIPSLDYMTAGIQNGWLVIFAARPSMGKSALVCESALRLALRGMRVLMFSLEMLVAQIIQRWASSRSGVETDRVRRGRMPMGGNPERYATDQQLADYAACVAEFTNLENIYIDDTTSLTMPQIRARTSRVSRMLGGLDLIVIDTGNLINNDGRFGANTATIEGEKTTFAKALAKEFNCPVFMVWQLSRRVEQRTDRRPMLSDLRDSGEVEQDADIVFGLYRDAYYANDQRLQELARNGELYNLEVLALKQREGTRNMRQVIGFRPHLLQFFEIENGEEPPF